MASFEWKLEGKRVLVVEDREENQRLMRAILKLEGAIMLEAEDGESGLQIAEQEKPDLILMDFQMPRLDGITVTRLLHDNPSTSEIPVLLVTATAGDETRRAAEHAGACGFITKPIDPIEFAGQVELAIRQASR